MEDVIPWPAVFDGLGTAGMVAVLFVLLATGRLFTKSSVDRLEAAWTARQASVEQAAAEAVAAAQADRDLRVEAIREDRDAQLTRADATSTEWREAWEASERGRVEAVSQFLEVARGATAAVAAIPDATSGRRPPPPPEAVSDGS
ncbi:hypothetical protein [Pseudokineococcus lusitanus]|uniref:Uncharacterized protein n=1 Tax=Pseudokineococcus lusitanus TaxID=763993 RepID=A0A3N1HTU9_9ACTN|nr:hypothetical protein [Pseudokineococcus lusitanus]ROP45963.1 hypothetical protein EDC03_0579 [Pseudokineococcus lusitanus]